MKIDNPKRFVEALNHDRELSNKTQSAQRYNVQKVWDVLDKLKDMVSENEEAVRAISEASDILDNLYNRMTEARHSSSFQDCVMRILTYEANSLINHEEYPECAPSEYYLRGDFAPYSMTFSERREDGGCGLCGGIIYHGTPDSGYEENGSVSISPSYGWQIHT